MYIQDLARACLPLSDLHNNPRFISSGVWSVLWHSLFVLISSVGPDFNREDWSWCTHHLHLLNYLLIYSLFTVNQPWYYGKLLRQECEYLMLSKGSPRQYLVRDSSHRVGWHFARFVYAVIIFDISSSGQFFPMGAEKPNEAKMYQEGEGMLQVIKYVP